MFAKIAVVVAIVLVVAFLLYARRGDVSGAEARKLVAGGAKLIDVRSPEEFARGHIDGAINIPVQELSRRVAEVGAKDGEVVLYCASGMRSARAAGMLRDAGYQAVHNLGGMSAW